MAETKVEPNTLEDAETFLLCCKKKIEKKGDIARLHHDTLVKRGISVDQCLSPSAEKDLKKIKYYARVSFVIDCRRILKPRVSVAQYTLVSK